MELLSVEPVRLLNVIAYSVLGVAIGVRALAFPTSPFQRRIIALGAFGVLQSAALLIHIFAANFNIPISPLLHSLLFTPGHLSLFYFAFGWDAKYPMLAPGLVAASLAAFSFVSLFYFDGSPTVLPNRMLINFPTALCAGFVLARDPIFRAGSSFANSARWVAAFGFFLFAVLSPIVAPADYFPASVFNSEDFLAAFGISIRGARTLALIAVLIGAFMLLNHFDNVMRLAAHAKVHIVDTKLKKALQITGLGSWEWDVSKNRGHWSKEMCDIFGVEPEHAERTYGEFRDLVYPDDREMIDEAVGETIRNGTPFHLKFRIVRGDGRERIVEAQGELSHGVDGNPSSLTGSCLDITQEEETKKELIEARARAEAASEAKSNFIANMSHELRTPLNAILGFSEIILSESYGPIGNPRYQDYIHDINKSGQHLLSLVNDVLAVSRLEAGKQDLETEDLVDIGEVFAECVKWIRANNIGNDVKITTKIHPEAQEVMGDQRLLTQALLNLLSNAVKFTPDGGSIFVTADQSESGGLCLSVKDTGVGMTPAQVSRIGETFLQFDGAWARKYNGSGLGLSITKRFVELHGGELRVDSAQGSGSTFSVILPPERTLPRDFREGGRSAWA